MRKIYVSSDPHFCHKRILEFTGDDGKLIRGDKFKSIEEHDEYIVSQHNSVVGKEDLWYCLGDVYFNDQKRATELLARMNGTKRLILGNHDDGKDKVLQLHFQKILVWRVFKEFNCVLTHIPLHETSINEKVQYNIHGHIHQNLSPTDKHINLSMEALDDYKPILLEELMGDIAAINKSLMGK
jgi:calcineurin-like phosphoesterase family protein